MTIKKTITSESAARRALNKMGYSLHKNTKVIENNPYHSGCYRIVNLYNNTIEAGENFDLTLEDVVCFIYE